MKKEWIASLFYRQDQTVSLNLRQFVKPDIWRAVTWPRYAAADEIAAKLRELAAAIEDADVPHNNP